MSNASTISETAARSADLLEEHGHTKFKLMDEDGRMCANGAIGTALGIAIKPGAQVGHTSTEVAEAFHEVRDALARSIGAPYVGGVFFDFYDIPGWNNAEERTAEEVITAFRKLQNDYAYLTYTIDRTPLTIAVTQVEVELAAGQVS